MDPKNVGPVDTQLQLQAAGAVTASANGTALDLGAGWAPAAGGVPMLAILPFTALKRSAGNETYAFKLQDSPDNSTWTDAGANRATADDGYAADGTTGLLAVGGFIRNRYVRLVMTLAGTAPTITLGQVCLQPQVNCLC